MKSFRYTQQCRVWLYVTLFAVTLAGARGQTVKVVPAQNPDYETILLSPDHRFVARVFWDANLVANLEVYKKQPNYRTQRPVVENILDVNGFMWLPKHPHTLVFSTCGFFGNAGIAQFDGSAKTMAIISAKDPKASCYELYGGSANGDAIIYGYAENYRPKHEDDIDQIQIAQRTLRVKHTLFLKGKKS